MSLNLGVPECTSVLKVKKCICCAFAPNIGILGVPYSWKKPQTNLLKDCDVVISTDEGSHLKVTWTDGQIVSRCFSPLCRFLYIIWYFLLHRNQSRPSPGYHFCCWSELSRTAWFACPEVTADAATVTMVVKGAKNSLSSWDAKELSKWQDKCTQTTRTLFLTPDKKEVCHLPKMTSNVGPLISFDPGLQEDGCCILLGIGIRAELSRSCRK